MPQKSVWGVPTNNVTPKMKDVINSEMGVGIDHRQITATPAVGAPSSLIATSVNTKKLNINDDKLLKGKKM